MKEALLLLAFLLCGIGAIYVAWLLAGDDDQ